HRSDTRSAGASAQSAHPGCRRAQARGRRLRKRARTRVAGTLRRSCPAADWRRLRSPRPRYSIFAVSAAASTEIAARAVWFVAPYQVEIREASSAAPRAGELLVRTEFSGISAGTELLAYRGQLDPRLPRDETLTALGGTFAYPFTYGYSVVGTVEASHGDVGEGARVFAFAPHQDRLVVSGADVVPVADADARAATLFPLVATALQVTLDAGVRYGEVAVVLGLGPVGILTSMLLARSGATVFASDPKPWRRELAQRCGISAIEPGALPEAASTATGNRGVDVLIEA